MALVKLPCLSADATGSVGKSLTFVPNSPRTIVRHHQPSRPKVSYPSIAKPFNFSAYSIALTAIAKQSATVQSGSYLYNLILACFPHHFPWYPTCMRRLSGFFITNTTWNSYFSDVSFPGLWADYCTIPFLYNLLAPEYSLTVNKWQLFLLQALAVYLLKPYTFTDDWNFAPPHQWDGDAIEIFLNSQLNHTYL